MNKRIKKLWIKALRSGEYKQAQYALRCGTARNPSFCCLGVLCDLHRQETGGNWTRKGKYCGSDSTLPLEVMEWAKLPVPNPDVPGGIVPNLTMPDSLAGLNDYGADFNQIADAIEKAL